MTAVGQNAKYSTRADVFRFLTQLRKCGRRGFFGSAGWLILTPTTNVWAFYHIWAVSDLWERWRRIDLTRAMLVQ